MRNKSFACSSNFNNGYSSTFVPYKCSALALLLVMKHNDAALSHITFAHPFLVLTLCIRRRHVSLGVLVLLHALAVAETFVS